MFEHRLEKSGESVVLSFSGELSLEKAVEFREVLLEALNGANSVVIDILDVDVVDLAVLQLLCSAHRMALISGKSFSVSGYPEPFTNAIREAGLSRFVCRNDVWRAECLWPEKMALPAECK